MLHIADDQPRWEKEYKSLVKEQLNIPGLHMMGYANFNSVYANLPTHYHHTMEIIVILNGKQQYLVNEKRITLYGGDIFMTFPEELHGNGYTPQDICEFIWFQLDLSSSSNFLGLTSPYSDYLFEYFRNYKQRVKQIGAKNLGILRESFFMLSSSNMQTKLLGYSYFLQFLMTNLFTHETSADTEQKFSEDIQNATSYIHSHLMDDFTIEDVSFACNLSLSHFNAKFKKEVGMTPYAYITDLKIDTAKVLLKNPELSIIDIAYQLNFSSSNHFSTVFKKNTGYTPSYFRSHHCSDTY